MSILRDLESQMRTEWADIPDLAKVRVIATERQLDDVTVPTALIRRKTLARTPGAPLSHRNYGLLLTIISPHLDLDRAGDQLETLTGAVLDYLDPRFQHESASTVGYGERLADDIPFTVIANKE